jgi:hypothetical protein
MGEARYLTADEYDAAQRALSVACGLLRGHDWVAFRNSLDRAEAIGPVLDPSLYRAAMGRLPGLREMAQSAMALLAAESEMVAGDPELLAASERLSAAGVE